MFGGWRPSSLPALLVASAAALPLAGTERWFSHPIDQSRAGAPDSVPGNPVYNVPRGADCEQ